MILHRVQDPPQVEVCVEAVRVKGDGLRESISRLRIGCCSRSQYDTQESMGLSSARAETECAPGLAFRVRDAARVVERQRVQVSGLNRIGPQARKLREGFHCIVPALELHIGNAQILPGIVEGRIATHCLFEIPDCRLQIITVSSQERGRIEHARVGRPCVTEKV